MTHHRHLLSLLLAMGLVAPAGAQETTPATAPAAAEATTLVTVANTNDRVLVQRGQDVVPATISMPLKQTDRIVVLEGGSVQISCEGTTIATYTTTGVYDVPACGAALIPNAAAQPAVVSVPSTVPAGTVAATSSGSSITNWVVGGAVVAAILAAPRGSGSYRPVSP